MSYSTVLPQQYQQNFQQQQQNYFQQQQQFYPQQPIYFQNQPTQGTEYYVPSAPTSWGSAESGSNCCNYRPRSEADQKRALIIVSIALVVIGAIAAYFCLSNGFNMLDMARTSLQEVGGGTLAYIGVTFSGVAVGNFLYAGVKLGCSDRDDFSYTPAQMKKQILVSLFAPVVAIPVALYVMVSSKISSKMSHY